MEFTQECFTQSLLSFFIAFLLAGSTMLFGRYGLNHTILWNRRRYLVWYSLMYGIIAFLVTLIIIGLKLEINSGGNKVTIYNSPWIVAICIGMAYKAVANMNLFSLNLGKDDLNFGFKLITEFLDSFLNERIRDDVDERLLPIIDNTADSLKAEKFNNIDIDKLFHKALPSNLAEIQYFAYMEEIKSYTDIYEKCSYFAQKFGYKRIIILQSIMNRVT